MKKTILITLLCLCMINNSIVAQIKPYNEVITSEMTSKKGFLQVHQFKNKLYLEIPLDMLDKDMLFVKHARHSDYKQIMWTKIDNKIHLIIPEIKSEVGNIIPAVKGSTIKKITPAILPILAIGSNNSSYVIDVTSLFLNPPKELPGSGDVIFEDLAAINKVIAVDSAIEVKTIKTIKSKDGPVTVVADFSLFLLPKPMMPRLFDHRMGFLKEMGPSGGRTEPIRASIMRWRLEKKNKNKLLSDPIKPITLYFDPATPAKYKRYIKAGIEEWLPAFEAAGFKNAIEVKDPPTHDKNWSINSMRYSYIRWEEHNSSGGVDQVIDKRTGEILQVNLLIGGNPMGRFYQYFVRCSPLDPRAQDYPFPDDLLGELFQQLVAHEAGHAWGISDANYGEYTYPFEKMRDEKWLQDMGHTPSIMNYARQNFIVQPEDHIPPVLLHQKVGPTDLYNIRWGYTPFNDANTPDAELPFLEKIVREQDTVPWYIFTMNDGGPQGTDEVVESDNPIKATALGIKNLKRVIQLIPLATQHEPGDEIKKRLYIETLSLWSYQMRSVISLVGSYTATQLKSGAKEGPIYKPIPANRQKEAVAFLIKEAFNTPLWMIPPDLLSRFESNTVQDLGSGVNSNSVDIISKRQIRLLWILLSSTRINNMVEIEQTTKSTYSVMELFEDLNEGLWSELNVGDVKINAYRQEIQIAYITVLKGDIEGLNRANVTREHLGKNKYYTINYTRGIMLKTLDNLEKSIKEALKRTKDIATKGHLELCLSEIENN